MSTTVRPNFDIDSLDFPTPEIGCELCGNPATTLCRGCNDNRFWTICRFHEAKAYERFAKSYGHECSGCETLFLFFEDHWKIRKLLG